MTAIGNQQTQENYKKCLLRISICFHLVPVASIVLRQLFSQEIWEYTDLNGDVTRW